MYDCVTAVSLARVHVCELFIPCLSVYEFSYRRSEISAVMGYKNKGVFTEHVTENARHMLICDTKGLFTYHQDRNGLSGTVLRVAEVVLNVQTIAPAIHRVAFRSYVIEDKG